MVDFLKDAFKDMKESAKAQNHINLVQGKSEWHLPADGVLGILARRCPAEEDYEEKYTV